MTEKMKRDRGEFFFPQNVSRPSNPPDELAQNVSKKNPFRMNYSFIFLQKFRIWPFFNYLHDSNSIFWAQGIKSEGVSGGTVSGQASLRSASAGKPRIKGIDETLVANSRFGATVWW